MTEVRVGDRSVALPELNGFKAVRAMRLMSEVARVVPEVSGVLARLREDYAEQNALVITPALARLPRFQREVLDEDGTVRDEPMFSDADFEAAGGEIRVPQDPPVMEQIVAVFPVVFDAAEGKVVELLALLLAPNSELADADEEGTVDEYLKSHGKKLLHSASFDQLIAIIVAAVETVTNALSSDGGGALEKVIGAITGVEETTEGKTPETSPTAATEPFTQASQTDSLIPTDGLAVKSSTESVGENSKASSSA